MFTVEGIFKQNALTLPDLITDSDGRQWHLTIHPDALIMPPMAGWRRVKPCDVGIDAHRSTDSQSVALRQPAYLSLAYRGVDHTKITSPASGRGIKRNVRSATLPRPTLDEGSCSRLLRHSTTGILADWRAEPRSASGNHPPGFPTVLSGGSMYFARGKRGHKMLPSIFSCPGSGSYPFNVDLHCQSLGHSGQCPTPASKCAG